MKIGLVRKLHGTNKDNQYFVSECDDVGLVLITDSKSYSMKWIKKRVLSYFEPVNLIAKEILGVK